MRLASSDIVVDYERSHTAPGLLRQAPEIIARTSAKYGHSPDANAVRALLGAKEAYIKLAFDAIVERSGSIDAYLDGLGFDRAARETAIGRYVE
jgi:protein-tyrosine phosphatase